MSQQYLSPNEEYPFLRGGGEMGGLIRSIQWSETPVGAPSNWPSALRQSVNMMLTTSFPILICWGADYTQFYNDAFRPINGESKHPQAMGGSARDTYAEIWDTIGPMFESVMAGESVGFPDFMVTLNRNGFPEDCYFDFSYSPIRDDDGLIQGVRVICVETTEKVKAIEKLKANEENIRHMVRQAPVGMCIVSGTPLYVVETNDRFLEIIGKPRKAFSDTAYWVVNQEAAAFYEPITDKVLATGETYHATEHEILLIRNGEPETVFVDFVYEPMKNTDGTLDAIMIVAIEVTEKVLARRVMEEATEELAASNEELAAMNEELAAANEEQVVMNEELSISRAESEIERERLSTFVEQAPAGICILGGPDLVYELVNPGYQALLPGRALLNKPIFEALPELIGTPLQEVLLNVYRTGQSYHVSELLIPVSESKGSPTQNRYFTFTYLARKSNYDEIDGILVFVYEVTDHVMARKKVEETDESLRIAIESAELGTWMLRESTNEFQCSSRFKEIFGFENEEALTYEQALGIIHPDHQERVADAAQTSIKTAQPFNVEYSIIGYHDKKLRWIRSVGKLVRDEHAGNYITGVILDITQQKQDDQRKNDFIAMVSHELKTPLTSLSGIIQLLSLKLKDHQDEFMASASDRAYTQVKRMTSLINGFLNISRLESSKISIQKQFFDLEALILEAIAESKVIFTQHRFTFVNDCNVQVNADRDKISSVISNLLSNAAKYSPNDKDIAVTCWVENNTVTVSIRDRGIGITPEDREKIFDRYYRVENIQAQYISGFGIGLYLCAEIISHHGGKIWLTSEKDKGSTFYFSLEVS